MRKQRVSTVVQRQDSIGSFEDLEDFDSGGSGNDIPQRTTKERTSDPPEDGFEVIDHDDLGAIKPRQKNNVITDAKLFQT